jgi:circadian clock protein KaiC
MSMEFLVRGVTCYNEPGVFMSFEERVEDTMSNMESIHFELATLVQQKKLYLEYLDIDKSQFAEVGEYDLEGLFIRIDNAVKKIGARRIVLDSLDALFFRLDGKILRQEIKRLFKWLKEKNITALITAGMDNEAIVSDGLEQYVADCVIALDNRIVHQVATRRIRILKMRGSMHESNEYPFVIGKEGMRVLPIISQLKNQQVSKKRISSGIIDLDGMLDGKGFFQGSSILVSGSAGTGKTSIAVSFINESCKLKMRSLFCAFEESVPQIIRNMDSIGLKIEPFISSGTLQFYSARPTLQNLELHLIAIKKIIGEFKPQIVVLDPVTNLMSEGINSEIRQMLTNFVDLLKEQGITTFFTAAITLETIKSNPSDEGISAMMDTWVLVNSIESNHERNREIYVLKSRGMNHSTQIREFIITDKGIILLPVYLGPAGVLTGTSKLEQTLKKEQSTEQLAYKNRDEKEALVQKRKIMEDKIDILKSGLQLEQNLIDQRHTKNDFEKEMTITHEKEILALRNKINSSKEKSRIRNK